VEMDAVVSNGSGEEEGGEDFRVSFQVPGFRRYHRERWQVFPARYLVVGARTDGAQKVDVGVCTVVRHSMQGPEERDGGKTPPLWKLNEPHVGSIRPENDPRSQLHIRCHDYAPEGSSAVTADLGPLSMRRLDLVANHLPQFIQVCSGGTPLGCGSHFAGSRFTDGQVVQRFGQGCVPVGPL